MQTEKQILGDPQERLTEVFKGKPIDRTARLVTGRGIGWTPEFKNAAQVRHSENPHPFKVNHLSGVRFGRLTVLGEFNGIYAPRSLGKNVLVVRCCCGRYELRRGTPGKSAYLSNPEWAGHMCLRCVAVECAKAGKLMKTRKHQVYCPVKQDRDSRDRATYNRGVGAGRKTEVQITISIKR